MENDTFQIITAQMVNPTSNVPNLALILAIGFIAGGMMLNDAWLKFRSFSGAARFGIVAATMVSGIVIASTWNAIDKRIYPEAYTSHITCTYELANQNETIQHTTLVPRVDGARCGKVGDTLVRVKAGSYSGFFTPFQIPN